MNEQEFMRLIKKDQYQVFLFSSRIPLPLSFVCHTWIVVVEKGTIQRWETLYPLHQCKTSWEHLHLNALKPWRGLKVIPYLPWEFSSVLLGMIEGKKGSLSEQMIRYIKKNAQKYNVQHPYHVFPGPNSNTFTQWMLKQFPEIKWRLPWNAFGKGYLSFE